jgi:aspartate racemase
MVDFVQSKVVIGILGGMGPVATAEFFSTLLAISQVRRESEHAHILVDCDPGIPSRAGFLAGKNASPVPAMRAGIQRLAAAGAQYILVACNTAHFFVPEIAATSPVPILNMVDETVRWLGLQYQYRGRVAVLGTAATVLGCPAYPPLYAGPLGQDGWTVVPVPMTAIEQVRTIIDVVKSGDSDHSTEVMLQAVLDELEQQGVDVVILGCSELAVPGRNLRRSIRLAHPTLILAARALELCGVPVKSGVM